MKLNYSKTLFLISCLLGFSKVQAKEETLEPRDSVKVQQELKKGDLASEERGDRNVMLNAANNSGPRDVNIGLPATVGGITILENDLPVVYFFWPELPNKTWRQNVGLKTSGLLKMGLLGFAVNSYTQNGTKEFKGKAKLTGSHFGWFHGDVNVSGPISDDDWTYSSGAFVNFDPSTYDLGFNEYVDQSKIFRAGLSKYFNNNKGEFNIYYKYVDSYVNANSAVFEYGPNGEAREIDDFEISNDSYIIRDGIMRFRDIRNGEFYFGEFDGAANTNTSHTVDVFGNYKLDNGWNFKYSTRLHLAEVSLMYGIPLSIFDTGAADGYTIAGTGTPYIGRVGTQLGLNSPEIPITTIMGRFSINRQIEEHNITLWILEQYYNVDKYVSNRALFFQTVENQPQRLIGAGTDKYGFYGDYSGAEYFNGTENKLAVYAKDN